MYFRFVQGGLLCFVAPEGRFAIIGSMASCQQGNPVAEYPALEGEQIPQSVGACNIEAWVGVKDGVSLSALLLNLKAQHRNTTQRTYMKTTINQSRGRCNQSIFKHGQGRDILTTRPFCNVCLQSANLKSETQ